MKKTGTFIVTNGIRRKKDFESALNNEIKKVKEQIPVKRKSKETIIES
jgi:PhoPQ-activated pathogenicity-related protein